MFASQQTRTAINNVRGCGSVRKPEENQDSGCYYRPVRVSCPSRDNHSLPITQGETSIEDLMRGPSSYCLFGSHKHSPHKSFQWNNKGGGSPSILSRSLNLNIQSRRKTAT
ncbi:hypothetical protein RRG08_045431 [Elysia crispata]|uniref:Uncharacterized protein n=1 Tax=Elysia crispata TaxID=231223 RepID=A0AAE1AY50_9GAST|nr:hypothetical protein RRG08_045431 [Elysia crispata]